MLGLIAGPLIIITGVAAMFGLIKTGGPVMGIATVPEFIWELFLGIYPLVWGFNLAAPILRGDIKRSQAPGVNRAAARTGIMRLNPRFPEEFTVKDVRHAATLSADQPMLRSSWSRAAALSGIAFAVFLVLAWFLNGAVTPHYNAPDHDWTTWANNTEMKGRFAAFFALLAGLVFLPYAATIRGLLGTAEGHAAVPRV